MSRCKNCGKRIWVWPTGIWTHSKSEMTFCYPGPGGDRSKRAEPSDTRPVTATE